MIRKAPNARMFGFKVEADFYQHTVVRNNVRNKTKTHIPVPDWSR